MVLRFLRYCSGPFGPLEAGKILLVSKIEFGLMSNPDFPIYTSVELVKPVLEIEP